MLRCCWLQIAMGFDLDDMDLDVDNDERPQAGECIRKEYRRLTTHERDAYHAALRTMKNNGEYRIFVQHHRPADSPGAHFGPAFYCWHRVYLILCVLYSTGWPEKVIHFRISIKSYRIPAIEVFSASEVRPTTSWCFTNMLIIIFYQGKTPGAWLKITKENYETCLEVNPTLAGRHQGNHHAAKPN